MASLKFLGHASFELELDGKIIYFDPWWNPKPPNEERLVAPALNAEQVRKADLILVSHEHFDHCDPADVTRVHEKTMAQVIAPEATLRKLDKVNPRSKMTAYVGDSFQTGGVDITVTPAKHPQSEYPVGFLVSAGGKSVYFAGDTYDFYEMSKIKADVALLPIGGTYTMDIFGALKALKFMRCENVIPMHYNTFKDIKADVREFEKKVMENTKSKPAILEVGYTFDF